MNVAYHSAACDAVIRRVDEYMKLRAEVQMWANRSETFEEYFRASQLFQYTMGHEEATAEDEHKAETRLEAALEAARILPLVIEDDCRSKVD